MHNTVNYLSRAILLLYDINILKTIYVNLKVFGLNKHALKFPILIYKYTEFDIKKHSIRFKCKPIFGLIKIGRHRHALYPKKHDYTKFSVEGIIEFCGSAHFFSGSRVVVKKNGFLRIGNGFSIGSQSSIIVTHSITLGNNVMISWDTLIMDSDLHRILNRDGELVNSQRDIYIGNNVWIGCRCCLLKGVHIPDGNIISATSLITKQYDISDCIIASNNIIKSDIIWDGRIFY